ncbi:lipoprotein [Psychrobacter sp. JCM 18900]|nr:lipoprotein [Psychrobacter sp. JCM 18900]
MLTGSLLLSAVSMSVNAGSFISSTEYLPYQLPSNIQEMCDKRDNCPEIEVKYLKSSQNWIDEIANARIDNLVVNSQMTESAPIKGKSSEKEVTAAIDGFVSSQFQDMPDDVSWGYNLMVAPHYLGHVDDFELFEISSYVYTGGAHGMPYSEYLIFDPSTKKQITLDDMLISDKKPRFEALAYDAYKVWVKTVAEDVSSYEKNWPFTLSDNVTLTDTGISIRYQHYSIGPYAYGMPVLNIPYSKLDKVIKPRFIPK